MQSPRIKGALNTAWYAAVAIALLAGGFAAMWGVVFGIGGFNTDDVVFWGLPMAGYLFFVLTAAGLTVLSSLPTVFGLKRYYPLAKRASFLALATLTVGLMCKGLDLGPWTTFLNLPWVILSPNPQSPIWWMAIFYGAYFAFAAVKFFLVHKGRWHSHGGKEVAVLVLMLSGLSFVSLSILFGSVEGRPGYFGLYMSAYFIVTALLSGCAAVLLAEHSHGLLFQEEPGESRERVLGEVTSIFRWLLAISLFMVVLRYFIGAISPGESNEVFRALARSPIFFSEVLIGLALPFLLLFSIRIKHGAFGRILVSALALIGMLGSRLGHLLAGNLQPLGVMTEGRPAVVSYAPSIFEWGVILLALTVVLAAYTLGVRWLRLEDSPSALEVEDERSSLAA